MDYDHDFEETATGLWSLDKLKAMDDSINREVAEEQKEKRAPILLPAKTKQEIKNNEPKRIHT